jgi:predicted secreted Zn-dependent protease
MRYVRATTATHTGSASTAAPVCDVLAATTARARSASPAAAMRYLLPATSIRTPAATTMRYVLVATGANRRAGIAGATMPDMLATVHRTMTLTNASATAAGINNPLATASAKI